MASTDSRPSRARTGARRLPSSWRVAAGFLALLGVYFYRSGWAVWPHLFRDGGDFAWYFRAAGEMLAGYSPFLDHFDYPPLVAFLALPFHPLGLDGARIAWFAFSQLCLLGAAFALFRALGGDRAAGWTVGALWAGAGTIPENLAIGQVQPPMLLLLCLAWMWDSEDREPAPRTTWAAAAIGVAAGLKIWPGMLLAAFLGRERRKALLSGLGAATMAVALPLAMIAALLPPPHLPTRTDYWMGTPAFLNTSLPALVLRATEPGLRSSTPPPSDWRTGNNPEGFRLEARRRRLSVAVALGALALGLLAIGLFVLKARRPDRLPLLAALTALATLASPISWYHYQIFQLPALALLATSALRGRAWWRLAALAVLTFALTRAEARGILLGEGTAGEVLRTGAAIVALHLAVLALLLQKTRQAAPSP